MSTDLIGPKIKRREAGRQMLQGSPGRVGACDVEKNVRVQAGIRRLGSAEIDHNNVPLPAHIDEWTFKPVLHGVPLPAATTAQMRSNISRAERSPSSKDFRKVASFVARSNHR